MVYVEYVILNNLIENTIIFKFTAKLIDKKGKRIVFPILIATIFGVLFPTIKVSELVCFLIKLLTAFLLVFCLTGKVKIKKFLVALFVFYCISFCVAGATSAFINSVSFLPKECTEEELTFFVLLGGIAFILVWENAIEFIVGKAQKKVQKIYVKDKNSNYQTFDAFVDTGNEITYHQKGVLFVPNAYQEMMLFEDKNDFIMVKTTTGEKIFKVYELEEIKLENGKVFSSVPILFWDAKDKKIILHRSLQ